MMSLLLLLIGLAICALSTYEAVIYWKQLTYVTISSYLLMVYYGVLFFYGMIFIA